MAAAGVLLLCVSVLLLRTSATATAAQQTALNGGSQVERESLDMTTRAANTAVSSDEVPSPKRQFGSRARGAYVVPDTGQDAEPGSQADLEPLLPDMAYGSVALVGAQFASEFDENGQEVAMGVVLIVNDGDYAINNFRLTLHIGGADYGLTPMDGLEPIEPGEQVAVPVLMNGVHTPSADFEIKTVTIQATVDGPPGTCSATTYVVPA